MALNDHKIANLTNPIESLPDHPSADGINAETLKKAFDKSPNEIKDKLNDVIDNLLSNTDNDSGADNIGSTAISGITGDTVQAQLEALKAFIDAAILGYINDGTITNAKLHSDIKIGSLAGLTTEEKTEIVGAINEHETQINSLDANGNLKVYKTLIGEPYNQTTKTTVNCGFKPRLITIQACIMSSVYESTAYITQDGTSHYIATTRKTAGNIRNISISKAVYFENESAANQVSATIVITETGFELTWTVQGTMETTEQRRMIVVAQA